MVTEIKKLVVKIMNKFVTLQHRFLLDFVQRTSRNSEWRRGKSKNRDPH